MTTWFSSGTKRYSIGTMSRMNSMWPSTIIVPKSTRKTWFLQSMLLIYFSIWQNVYSCKITHIIHKQHIKYTIHVTYLGTTIPFWHLEGQTLVASKTFTTGFKSTKSYWLCAYCKPIFIHVREIFCDLPESFVITNIFWCKPVLGVW